MAYCGSGGTDWCVKHWLDRRQWLTPWHSISCVRWMRSPVFIKLRGVEEANCHLLVGVCSWYWLMSFRGGRGSDARPPCSHDQTIHCEWAADFVSSDRVLRLLNKIWLSSLASHNVKLLAATPPKNTKVPLCCGHSCVRKATVLWPLELHREMEGGGRLGFQ